MNEDQYWKYQNLDDNENSSLQIAIPFAYE